MTRFSEGDTVRVIAAKKHPFARKHSGKKGFIDEVLFHHKIWGQHYYVNFLSDEGELLEGCKIPDCCLITDVSLDLKEAKRLYDETVSAIVDEADMRSKKWSEVVEHVAKRYEIDPNVAVKVYRYLRDFESYHGRWIEK